MHQDYATVIKMLIALLKKGRGGKGKPRAPPRKKRTQRVRKRKRQPRWWDQRTGRWTRRKRTDADS